MKNIVLKSLGCLAAVALMVSCNDTMDDKADIDAKYAKSFEAPAFAVAGVEDVTYNSATVNLSLSDTTYVVEQGIQISKASDFSDATNIWVDKVEEAAVLEIAELEAETTYYVRPYIYMVNGSYAAGQATSFTTAEPPAESWTPRFVGTYTYAFYWEGDDEGLTLYKKDQDDVTWKIEHWGGDVDFIFTVDENGKVAWEPFWIGVTDDSYGDIYCYDMNALYGDEQFDPGYCDGSTFYFPAGYRVSAGWFGYPEGEVLFETFNLTGYAETKDRKPVKKASSPKVVRQFGDIKTR